MQHNLRPINSLSAILSNVNVSLPATLALENAYMIAKCFEDDILKKSTNVQVSTGRLLRALLDNASKDLIPNVERADVTGKHYMSSAICAAYKENKVRELALAWFDGMITPVKASGRTQTVQPSTEQTPCLEEMSQQLQSSERQQVELKNNLLKRENNRCILHPFQIERASVPPIERATTGKTDYMPLQAAHIVPYSLINSSESLTSQTNQYAATRIMIQYFTSVNIDKLMSDGINDPRNAVLLCDSAHEKLRSFEFWFEETDAPNCYNIVHDYSIGVYSSPVTFRAEGDIPPPNPLYFRMHAAFAKVLHDSTAGEYLDEVFHDEECLPVLAPNGGTDVAAILYKLLPVEVSQNISDSSEI
ncbi:hypothetical protein C8Q75DRAFT_806595 [Abortiporus biennis]|nr:hypothetical protein C8Q75DRAFT_806595 [Abortiporus biennis]